MTGLGRLGLGTAQFGSHYGISNATGHPDEAEIAAILDCAVRSGIGYLDTATSYGSAEILVGRHLPANHSLRIVTKMPAIDEAAIEPRHKDAMLAQLHDSLDRLRTKQVYGVLVHRGADFAKAGAEYLAEALHEAKARGWTQRIGVSIYDAEELGQVERLLQPELVQLPFNSLDRRPLTSGVLARLKADGIEVHARSIFLQGVLLMEPSALSDFFAPLKTAIAGLHARWASAGLTPLAGCLHAVLRPEIDAAIVGVNRWSELEEITQAVEAIGDGDFDDEAAANIDPTYLDPRRWS